MNRISRQGNTNGIPDPPDVILRCGVNGIFFADDPTIDDRDAVRAVRITSISRGSVGKVAMQLRDAFVFTNVHASAPVLLMKEQRGRAPLTTGRAIKRVAAMTILAVAEF